METIYAIDSCNGLSKNGTIPWKSKKDMAFFRTITTNNIVIMGKNTFFSIPLEHRPLKNRLNIVLTNSPYLYENHSNMVLFTNNINIHEDILKNKNKYYELYPCLNIDFKIFCIGGKNIYEQ
jgi:dihydrofolate reductase